ncbi:hypothetical protein [Phenylobacterium sp.]|uniref:hypothetical protein n=1 Tax=Phenylobacterium sp. TaxID=1871053 RepID=UPI0025DC6A96|nr:hypothetical protein [Phenylobacterium sp.]
MARPLVLVPILAGLLACAAPAFAADEPPTVTAPPSRTVADQIDAFLRDSPVAKLPTESEPVGVTSSSAPRQVHGEISVSAGSHGYRDVYARTDLPVGKTGTLSIAVEQGRGGYGYGGYGYGGYGRFGARGGDIQNLGVSLALGGSAARPCREARDVDLDRPDRCRPSDGDRRAFDGRPADIAEPH